MDPQNLGEDNLALFELTSQQQGVLEVLKDKETDKYPLSEWYLGALYALGNHHNPDRISQAAHSLRELIEKLPRVIRDVDAQVLHDLKGMRRGLHERFLKDREHYGEEWSGEINDHLRKTLRGFGDYLERNQQPTRKEQVQAAIAGSDPMVHQLTSSIREKKRGALQKLWQELENFTHHKGKPNIETFEQCLNKLEKIVFDLLAPITAQDQKEIQLILDRTAISEDDENRMLFLIERKGANFDFFFSKATDAKWIPVLKKRGYFDDLPKPEPKDDGRIRLPFWRPIFYLKKAAEANAGLVVDTILEFPDTSNPNILHEISEIALEVKPIAQSLRLKDWVFKYLMSPYHFDASDLFAKLIYRWGTASEKATVLALEVTKKLIEFQRDPQESNKQNISAAFLTPQPRFDTWEYQEILKKGVQPLADNKPCQSAKVLICAASKMIDLKFSPKGRAKNGNEDYSLVWCERVLETEKDYKESDENLVHTLTFACTKVYEKAPEFVQEMDQMLRDQRWFIFDRIRQHLYGMFPNKQTKPWIREFILNHENYSKWEYHFEFQRLVRIASGQFGTELLSIEEREKIFESILSGPSKQEFREWAGERFTEELFKKKKRRFHRMQLRPFSQVLFGEYSDYYFELEDGEVPIKDDGYEPFISKVFETAPQMGKQNPVPTEKLKNMQDEELLAFLNDWDNEHCDLDNGVERFSFNDFAQALQSIFQEQILQDKTRLDFWTGQRDEIKRPIYMRAIISAVSEYVKSKQFDMLDQGFSFCESVLARPQLQEENHIDPSYTSARHPDWVSSRREVCDFVARCLEADVPISARNGLATLLDKLCIQYDWHLDEDKPVFLHNQDQQFTGDQQFTEAIKNTRSRALESLVRFGYWVRRLTGDDQAETQEVIDILGKRFSPDCDYPLTLPEYAILGANYSNIWEFNKEWATKHKSDFFPQTALEKWKVAFGTFLWRCRPWKPMFHVLKDDIEFALENLSKFIIRESQMRGLTHSLGEHLLAYYLWDVYPLKGENSFLERFYKKTREHKIYWVYLFDHTGRLLKNTSPLENSVKGKIIEFFNWRLEIKEESELRKFTFWLKAGCLEAEWRLKSYLEVLGTFSRLDSQPGGHLTYSEMKVLCTMLEDHTALVVECLAKLTALNVKSNCTAHIHVEQAKSIIQAGLASGDEIVKRNANRAQENLLKCGYSGLLD